MAITERWLNSRFGDLLVDHNTWVLCGDGCLMEGITHEAASLAGHLGLGGLNVLYDDNDISIDGSTEMTFTEDVAARFAAYGWHVQSVDGHDREALAAAMTAAKAERSRPSMLCCKTVIGHGSPNLAGSEKTHGAPLGEDEIRATKVALGMDPDATFVVPEAVVDFVRAKDADRARERAAWQARLVEHPEREKWGRFHGSPRLDAITAFAPGKIATRKASHRVLNQLAGAVENLIGGSADLAGSNGSYLVDCGNMGPDNMGGRNVYYGVREHAMGAICNGMALHGGVIPFNATFLTFHDYMRPAVRLCALMKQRVVYVYTHDSVHLGEDGPTHQPVEQLQSMRAMMNLWVLRPADANETAEAWKIALRRTDGPSAMCLTRQGLPILDRSEYADVSGVQRGAYVLVDGSRSPDVVLVGTGSEVSLCLEARLVLEQAGVSTRVVSMPCVELFDLQDADYRTSVLPAGVRRVVVEAGVTFGWDRIAGPGGAVVGIDRFGASAPGPVVADKLGMNVDNVVRTAHGVLAD
jgi:transketolase